MTTSRSKEYQYEVVCNGELVAGGEVYNEDGVKALVAEAQHMASVYAQYGLTEVKFYIRKEVPLTSLNIP